MAQPRSNSHYLYYVLAAFDLLTISASLYLNHEILGIYSKSIQHSSSWVDRLDRFESIAAIAAQVNAPGNDVFDSHQVKKERARMEGSLKEFNVAIDAEVAALDTPLLSPNTQTTLKNHFGEIRLAMSAMVQEASRIFGYFERGDPKSAGSRMATMDQKFGLLNDELRALRKSVRDFQSLELKTERDRAQNLSRFELLFAGIIVLMILGVTWYGHLIARRMLESNNLIELQRNQIAASSKMASLGVMAGGIAHEINNPLGIIQGCSTLIEQEVNESEPNRESILRLAGRINSTVNRIAAIIRGLKSFSRDDSKDPFTLVEVGTLIEDSLALCNDKIKKYQIKLTSAENFLKCT